VSASPGKAPLIKHSLRRRIDADWPALLDVWLAAWRATYPNIDFGARRDWLVRHVSELELNGATTLCLFDEASLADRARPALAGFVVIDAATGWLDQLCVGPDYFGSGAADALIAEAQKISPERISLDVNADNIRAIRFYERRGFKPVGAGSNSLSGRATIKMEWRAALSNG
jgi:putative acetyltransferase